MGKYDSRKLPQPAHDLAEMIQLEEGSGISRGNRFTARGFAEVLGLFAPHAKSESA